MKKHFHRVRLVDVSTFHTAQCPSSKARKRWFPPVRSLPWPPRHPCVGWGSGIRGKRGSVGPAQTVPPIWKRPCLGPQDGALCSSRLAPDAPRIPPRWTAARAGVCQRVPAGATAGTGSWDSWDSWESTFAGLIGRIICTSADHRFACGFSCSSGSPGLVQNPLLTRILEPDHSKLCLSAVGACTSSAAARV